MTLLKVVLLSFLIRRTLLLPHDVEFTLGHSAHDIVEKHFSHLQCIGLITDHHSHIAQFLPKTVQTLQIRMSPDVQQTDTQFWEELDDATKDFESLLRSSMEFGCFGYIIQVTNHKSVMYSLARTTKFSLQRGELRLLLVPALHTSSTGELLVEQQSFDQVFGLKQLNNIPDIVVIKMTPPSCSQKWWLFHRLTYAVQKTNCSQTMLQFLTHKFVGTTGTEPILLETWSSGGYNSLALDNLYKDKLLDMQGKEVRVSVVHYVPYVVFVKGERLDGLESRIVIELSKMLNFTISVMTDEEFLWGTIYENGSGNGILGSEAEEISDMSFAAEYGSWYFAWNWTEFCVSYVRAEMEGLMPAPKLVPLWHNVYVPFSPQVWLATLTTFIASSLATFLVAQCCATILGLYTHKFLINFK